MLRAGELTDQETACGPPAILPIKETQFHSDECLVFL